MSSDVLSDLLRSLRVSGTVYFCDQLQAPWVKTFADTDTACFHQVRRGGCRVESQGLVDYLGPGDFIFLSPGRNHTLSSEVDNNSSSTDATALLLCGYCEFTADVHSPLSGLFPSVEIIRDELLQQQGWLKSLLSQLSSEYQSQRPGAELAVRRMTEVLIVELIRMNFGRQQQSPLMQALADKQIANALSVLHNDVSTAWTLDILAKKVGLSRAGFAKRFKDVVGTSMFDYLTRLRIQRAKELLIDTNVTLYDIADQVGYESDLSFSRTFKKVTGVTPTAYRKVQHSREQ